jgi:23S rRNA U2552 (ribose-2'-O)-methylase RlmE/FtsJ
MGSKTEADVLLADLSPPFSAVVDLDSFALRNLNLEVLFFAEKALKPGGSLVLRYLQSIHS